MQINENTPSKKEYVLTLTTPENKFTTAEGVILNREGDFVDLSLKGDLDSEEKIGIINKQKY